MKKDNSLEIYREIYKDLDGLYAMFSKICDLSDAEYWTLVMIKEGYTTQAEIRDVAHMNKQTVHSAIKQLTKKGLIALETKENNLREKQIIFTQEGLQFVQQHIDSMYHLEERVWKEMEKEEKELLIEISQKYNRLLKSELEKYLKRGD